MKLVAHMEEISITAEIAEREFANMENIRLVVEIVGGVANTGEISIVVDNAERVYAYMVNINSVAGDAVPDIVNIKDVRVGVRIVEREYVYIKRINIGVKIVELEDVSMSEINIHAKIAFLNLRKK